MKSNDPKLHQITCGSEPIGDGVGVSDGGFEVSVGVVLGCEVWVGEVVGV